MRRPRAPRKSAAPAPSTAQRRPAGRQPAVERPRGRQPERARSAPCGPCRTPGRPGARCRGRRCPDRTARRPGCRWRRAARASPRRAARSACRRRRGRRRPRAGRRPRRRGAPAGSVRCVLGEPRAAPASVGARPVRASQAVNTRAAVARRAIVVRDLPERLLLGQPAAQRAQVELGDIGVPEPGGVVEQAREVAEVGADGVRRQVALGDEVPLVVAEHPAIDSGSAASRPVHRVVRRTWRRRRPRPGPPPEPRRARAARDAATSAVHLGDRPPSRPAVERPTSPARSTSRRSEPRARPRSRADAGGARDRLGGRPRDTGTASSTCRSRRPSRSCGRSRPARPATRCSPAGADQLEHVGPPGDQGGAAVADQLVHALRRSRWSPGPGTPISARFSCVGPVGGVQRAAAHRGLDDHGASGSAAISRLRDRNRSLVGAQPGGASETTAPVSAMWSSRSRCAAG